jgi:DNA-binding MarR family transcriptional regulator
VNWRFFSCSFLVMSLGSDYLITNHFSPITSLGRARGIWTIDNCRTWLYHSYMNHAIASALVQAAHRVESRLEEALAGVGLSIAKFETLSVLVSQDRPISLSELAAKLVCVKSNVTQLVDRLETEGLVKRADDPADRRAVRAEVTALGRKRQAAGTPVVKAVLQDVANKLAVVDSKKLKGALDAIQ